MVKKYRAAIVIEFGVEDEQEDTQETKDLIREIKWFFNTFDPTGEEPKFKTLEIEELDYPEVKLEGINT